MLPNNYLYLFKFIGGIFAYCIYLALFYSKLKSLHQRRIIADGGHGGKDCPAYYLAFLSSTFVSSFSLALSFESSFSFAISSLALNFFALKP